MHVGKHRSRDLVCTDPSTALEQAREKGFSILECWQIGAEDSKIKSSNVCMHESTEGKNYHAWTLALQWNKLQTSFKPFFLKSQCIIHTNTKAETLPSQILEVYNFTKGPLCCIFLIGSRAYLSKSLCACTQATT